MATGSPLLDLPKEVLENIITFSLSPCTPDELARTWKSKSKRASPHRLLVQRLRPLTARKMLYTMGLPTYFRHTKLDAIVETQPIVTGNTAARFLSRLHTMSGTFELTSFYYENAMRLRLEVDNCDVPTVYQLRYVLAKCHKLTEVTVALVTLEKKGGEWFFAEITDIFGQMRSTLDHQLRIRRETKAEHRSVMAVRKMAERKHRQLLRVERRAERARAIQYGESDLDDEICCINFYEEEEEKSSRTVPSGGRAHYPKNHSKSPDGYHADEDQTFSHRVYFLNEFIEARHRNREALAPQHCCDRPGISS